MKRRGFTLVEIIVAIAIVATLATLAVMGMHDARQKSRLREEARSLVAYLNKARALAASGRVDPAAGWDEGDRTRSAGLRVIGARRYALFIDRDLTTDGDEYEVQSIDLSDAGQLVIQAPASGVEIRFRGNGTVVDPVNFVLVDEQSREERTIVISGGGQARIQ